MQVWQHSRPDHPTGHRGQEGDDTKSFPLFQGGFCRGNRLCMLVHTFVRTIMATTIQIKPVAVITARLIAFHPLSAHSTGLPPISPASSHPICIRIPLWPIIPTAPGLLQPLLH